MKKLVRGIAILIVTMVIVAGAAVVGYPIFLSIWIG